MGRMIHTLRERTYGVDGTVYYEKIYSNKGYSQEELRALVPSWDEKAEKKKRDLKKLLKKNLEDKLS